ncbi:MAG: GNAT family N-acetyltransferase [Paracoccaceae bacterium]
MDICRRAVLRTARLRLRPVTEQDAQAVIAGVGRLHVSRWLSVVPHPYGPADFARYLQLAVPGRHWAIEDGQGHAGGISLDPDLGFWIAPERQGRGYAAEAARAVIACHFDDPAAGPLRSGFYCDNHASRAVHRRLGFRSTGMQEVFCQALGQPRALLWQRLDLRDWQAASPPPAADDLRTA